MNPSGVLQVDLQTTPVHGFGTVAESSDCHIHTALLAASSWSVYPAPLPQVLQDAPLNKMNELIKWMDE